MVAESNARDRTDQTSQDRPIIARCYQNIGCIVNARALTAADVDNLAAAITDALASRPPVRYTDVAGVCAYLAMSDSWVRAHADDLGVVRVGSGSKPRLRFDLRAVDAFMKRGTTGQTSQPAKPQRKAKRRRAKGSGAGLLPVRGAQ